MDANWIITAFVVIDTVMEHLDHQSDVRAKVPDAEIVTIAVVAAKYFGVIAKRDDWGAVIHRTTRCDLSLFQLGYRLLAHLLKEGLPLPDAINFRILAKERQRE